MDNETKRLLDDIGAIPLPDDEIAQSSKYALCRGAHSII